MGIFKVFILIGFIILVIYLIKKQEHEEYQDKIKKNRKFELDCVHQGNKNILTRLGEEQFIQYFGKEQFDKIMAGTDTKIAEPIKERI